MSICIYTYHNPYRINEITELWDEIIGCPYFCVSQTLVNGLKSVYGDRFQIGRVTTLMNLTNSMYEDWVTTASVVKQHADIDNLVSKFDMEIGLSENELYNIKKSFLFNRDEVFSSIRSMFELRIDPINIIDKFLTPEQKFIVAIYNKIIASEKIRNFKMNENFTEAEIDKALLQAMQSAKENVGHKEALAEVDLSRIVIHGVHQFSPLMLRTIEEIAKYKKVILLINYQEQYKSIYQTWIDIYSAFDCEVKDCGDSEFFPIDSESISFKGNILAQNMGKLLNGKKDSITMMKSYEILEFDNMTEFASYVSKIYEDALRIDSDKPMSVMKEQIYSADSSANDILKVYFPEQFGERQFLNYPLGHFFIAIANMWDPETNGILISDIRDIRECLSAGILVEKQMGDLVSTFGKLEAVFEGCTSIDEMLSRLKRIKKNKKFMVNEERLERISHIAYYAASNDDINELEKALNDLEDLASFFYEDFEKRSHNFKSFYKKMKQYLQEEIIEERELSKEFEDILVRVLLRLEEVEDIDASASFECLKSTMSLYLVQETKPGKSANWIVRNFEQIDGDVLRSNKIKNTIIHFACLSDEDIDSIKTREFTWPLNGDFFEVAQNPVDWKYQVFVKSKKEYKNFKRYALIYGLEFNRGSFKLSYVKKDGDIDREPYYLLKILGVRKVPNIGSRLDSPLTNTNVIEFNDVDTGKYSIYDYYRFKICKKRMLFESLVEGTTVYKDTFLLAKYLEIWVENEVKECMQGLPKSEIILLERINEVYTEVKKYFPFTINVNRIDIINNIRGRLNSGYSFPVLSDEDKKYMMIKELFIYKQLKNPKKFNQDVLKDKFVEANQDKIISTLSQEALQQTSFLGTTDLWCKYCANREICVDYYAHIE